MKQVKGYQSFAKRIEHTGHSKDPLPTRKEETVRSFRYDLNQILQWTWQIDSRD